MWQSSGDESAVLWLDQIQEAVHTANQDQDDALKCKCATRYKLHESFSVQSVHVLYTSL